MTDPLHHILLSQIDAHALPRDRDTHDAEAQNELEMSILTSGLRQPIEIWQLSQPRDDHRYGLISGFRRLAAARTLEPRRSPPSCEPPRTSPTRLPPW
ncbi:ParB N-terminal domain-containing protein [uncultured Tateyamaria sp.]|uniref:ParB N-terminal domain-containing protein n=1 Tax=uncultured Tateyamaria sp. TaxID=455651 RepID=UPI00260B47CD|nr:ParB N-terminal domain-containing protein [uncultured Tateyamaria sp.]